MRRRSRGASEGVWLVVHIAQGSCFAEEGFTVFLGACLVLGARRFIFFENDALDGGLRPVDVDSSRVQGSKNVRTGDLLSVLAAGG